MPIYDFQCQGCQAEFEKLVRGTAPVECPACGSRDAVRLPSRFGVKSGGRFLASKQSGCDSCHASSCSDCSLSG